MAKYLCFLCRKKAKPANFCYGCLVFICESCDFPGINIPDIGHHPTEHTKCPMCAHTDKTTNMPSWTKKED